MKNLIFFLAVLLTALNVGAVDISSYTNSHGEEFGIKLLTKNDKPFYVSISCETKGNTKGEIWIKPNDVHKFTTALEEVKSKLEEWQALAQKNNVKQVSKDMAIKFPKVQFAWGLSDTFFANDSFKVKWVFQSSISIVLCTSMVKASTNRFISEMFIIRFYDVADIDSLIKALSKENIDKAIATLSVADQFK